METLRFLTMLVAALLLACCEAPRSAREQRLVLVTLDTLRYDSFAGSGGTASKMPLLAKWAEQATVFDRFYSATSCTQPTHASMFTGLHPWQHGLSRNRTRLPEEQETVAEQLKEAGFATAAVVASFPLSRHFGFAQGFDRFHDEFVAGKLRRRTWFEAAHRLAGEEQPAPAPEDAFYSLADGVTDEALAQLDAATARRQFFWFHYFDPHEPYGDSAGEKTMGSRRALNLAAAGEDPTEAVERTRHLYDLDVAVLDRSLGRLLARLERDAADLETHVVVVADHGESFGEDASTGHERRLISSQIHVPCIIRSPRLEAGARHDVAGSIDIAATLLAMAGLDGTPARDLAQPPRRPPRVLGMRRTYEEPFRDTRLDGTVHVFDGNLFYFVNERGEIYRGNSDQVAPEKGAENLRELFASFEEELARVRRRALTDPESEKGLRALGYLD